MNARLVETNQGVSHESGGSYAALDLGSNSFHLIVAREYNGSIEVIDKHREMVQLASGLDDSRSLTQESIERALKSLSRMSQRLRTLPHHNVRVVGTNALRQADNREDFIQRAESILGHNIDVISGQEEGRLVYSAVMHDIESREPRRLVIDIGGGSTEFILGHRFQPRLTESLHIGCISITERWFNGGLITKQNMLNAVQDAQRELEVIEKPFQTHGWDLAIGTSGTILAVQSILSLLGLNEITRASIKKLSRELLEFENIKNIDSSWCSTLRAQSLPGGLAILQAVFKTLGMKCLRVSSGALREGLLHDLIGRVHHDDMRERSVQSLIGRFQIDSQHASVVSETALRLYDLIYSDPSEDQQDDRQLLRWAALLHEIGLSISHIGYHKHGAYLLEHLDLQGFALTEQQRLAWLVRSHRRRVIREDPMPHGHSLVHLCVLLRLAVALRRNRSEEELPLLGLNFNRHGCHLTLSRSWLASHPLTRLDLEQETQLLHELNIQLHLLER